MGGFASSLLVFLFKGVKASAIVVKSDIPYKRDSYSLINEDKLEEKQQKYQLNKVTIEREKQKEQKETERNNSLKQKEELLNNLRNQLIIRGKDVKSPIVILNEGIQDINSANGVSCYINFINTSGKLAKYVNIDLIPYNRVFDQAYSRIDGESKKKVNVTNFIAPNDEYYAAWQNVWYNSTILFMKIKKIEMIFADGTKQVIEDPDLLKSIEFSADEQVQYNELKNEISNLQWKLSLDTR